MEEIGACFRKSVGTHYNSRQSCSRSSLWKRPSAASGRPRQRTWPVWMWSSWRRCCLSCFWTFSGFHPPCGRLAESQPLASERTGAADPQGSPPASRTGQVPANHPSSPCHPVPLPAAESWDTADGEFADRMRGLTPGWVPSPCAPWGSRAPTRVGEARSHWEAGAGDAPS
ncbi:centromere protein X isoform X2 [Hippopotamus amphibius kiboko]|uniref:centromere protein X isoform X2 n=1 Tax=Hippopotamus amphibius kiboko TaxID=575201 RepID=UPI0025919657|nr:centromere protein X isoform X2 [Hippopotamus amphibius kiboko]